MIGAVMRLVAFSDTHGQHNKVSVPDGDVLIFAGDFSGRGTWQDVSDFGGWFSSQMHKHKIWIAGNHDRLVEQFRTIPESFFKGCTYLENTGCTIGGVNFWGSPVTPSFNGWAFNVDRGPAIKRVWDNIVRGTNVLITHGPPFGKCDGPYPLSADTPSARLGCVDLKYRVEAIMPEVHIFGHLHTGYGKARDMCTEYYNVAICNEQYKPVNPCTVIDLGGSDETTDS
jgi:Icc-related predicted phosphoesterase